MPKAIIVAAPALPATNQMLTTQLKPAVLKEAVKAALMNGAYEKVRPYLDTVNVNQGVMGSLVMDRAAAAKELKEWGEEQKVEVIARANWHELDKAINSALRVIKDDHGNPIDRRSRRLAALSA
jgi:hypothetical protein